MYKSANRNAQRYVGGYGDWSRYSVGSSPSTQKKITQERKPGQSMRQLKVEQIERSPYFVAMREGRVK